MITMKKILFVCVENSCRSQMAEGLAGYLGKDILESYSAGSKPSGIVDPNTIRVMQETGIDISAQKSKGFYDLPVKEFDYVISLGCKDICPFFPADNHIEWKIEDPKGKSIEFYRKTRDLIKGKIEELIESIS